MKKSIKVASFFLVLSTFSASVVQAGSIPRSASNGMLTTYFGGLGGLVAGLVADGVLSYSQGIGLAVVGTGVLIPVGAVGAAFLVGMSAYNISEFSGMHKGALEPYANQAAEWLATDGQADAPVQLQEVFVSVRALAEKSPEKFPGVIGLSDHELASRLIENFNAL